MAETNGRMQIGMRCIRWGLGLLAFGIFIGFGIIGHCIIGANHDTGAMFMKNVTLWFASPWTLSVYAVQAGSLGMIVIGIMYLVLDDHALLQSNRGVCACAQSLCGVWPNSR